jgi:hypothetical protein
MYGCSSWVKEATRASDAVVTPNELLLMLTSLRNVFSGEPVHSWSIGGSLCRAGETFVFSGDEVGSRVVVEVSL